LRLRDGEHISRVLAGGAGFGHGRLLAKVRIDRDKLRRLGRSTREPQAAGSAGVGSPDCAIAGSAHRQRANAAQMEREI
jgi:hypothetical protein